MRAELLDPVGDSRWREFLDRAAAPTIFHHPAWIALLQEQYGYDAQACCLLDASGTVAGGLPWARVESRLTGRRLVALPFSDACAPLADDAETEALAAAVESTRASTGLGLEVRARFEALPGATAPHRFWLHTLALSADATSVERQARSGIRRGAAKARRSGLVAVRRTDAAALDAFYRLHLQTRRYQGVPTQSKRFIAALQRLFEDGLGFVMLVEEDRRPLAAAVFLHFRGHLVYKYGASERAALPRRPNNLLFSEVIRWGCENGCHTLDFGRTSLDNEGLRTFKLGWGADEHPLHYTYLGMSPPTGESSAERLIAPVIRRSPAFVGRAVGTALYRHFG